MKELSKADSSQEAAGQDTPFPPVTKGQPAGIKKASFIQRLITGAVFALLFIACIVAGNLFMLLPLLMMTFALIGTAEFYRIVSPDMPKVLKCLGMICAASMPFAIFIANLLTTEGRFILGAGNLGDMAVLFYIILFALALYMSCVALSAQSKIKDAAFSFFGALYLGVPLSSLLLIRDMSDGVVLALAVVFSIWAADSFAYLGGSLFGRHKLAPKISPKKSWEGLLAGTLGAIAFWYLIPFAFMGTASWLAAIVAGCIVSATSLVGDLFQSRIKRAAGVKDSGTLLPGHGGILDRIDSLLLTAPLMFLLLSTVGIALGLVGS